MLSWSKSSAQQGICSAADATLPLLLLLPQYCRRLGFVPPVAPWVGITGWLEYKLRSLFLSCSSSLFVPLRLSSWSLGSPSSLLPDPGFFFPLYFFSLGSLVLEQKTFEIIWSCAAWLAFLSCVYIYILYKNIIMYPCGHSFLKGIT